MAYTAATLISDSWYLSGIVAREFETVSATQMTDGLKLLNALLSSNSMTGDLIPFYKEKVFDCEAGKETYFIENMIEIETFTFVYSGNVRFSVLEAKRKDYRGSNRVEGITSLPTTWNQERVVGGLNLSVYFEPNSDYPFKVWGKFGYDEVLIEDDLTEVFDKSYIEYLRYALADYFCQFYTLSLPPASQKRLDVLVTKLLKTSAPDFTLQKISTLTTRNQAFNWALVNFPGWMPG